MNKTTNIRNLTISAIMVALTFVSTMFIQIRLPIMGNGGLIHLGNVPLFIAAFVFGPKIGFVAGAFGMALFDVVSGWVAWSPFTFVIVGAMGFVRGVIGEKSKAKPMVKYTAAVVVACIIKIVGYYFAEVILYGNYIAPLGSIPGNIIQVITAGVLVIPIADRLKKMIRGK